MSENINKDVLAMRYIAKVLRTMEYGDTLPPIPSGIDWTDVYSVSHRHSLASSVWYFLEEEVKKSASDDLVGLWEKERSLDFAKNLVQTAEFSRLTAAFSDRGYSFLPMKGFLFKELWKKPEYRTMADMDFYVSEDNFRGVSELLLSMGYTVDIEDGEVHDTFNKPPYIHVEIHKALRSGSTESFENWVPKEDNPNWYVMRPVDFMVFNVAHIHKHFTTGGCGARTLFDLHLYLEKRGHLIDSDSLTKRLADEGLFEFYKELFHLALFWFGDGVTHSFEVDSRYIADGEPTEELLAFEYFIITGGTYGTLGNRVEYALKKESRLGYVFRRIFLPYRKMVHLYKWLKKFPFLLPIAYIMRLTKALFNGRMKRELKAVRKSSGKE